MRRRGATALQVAKDGDADVKLWILLLDAFGHAHGATRYLAFGHEHDAAVLRLAETLLNHLGQLVFLERDLGDDGSFGAGGQGTVEGEEAGVASHDLDEEESLVRGGRVTDLVDALHDGVQGRIVTDGEVGAGEVVVDRTGQADDGEVVLLGEIASAMQAAVATDDDEGFDAVFDDHVVGLTSALGGTELVAAGGLEDGATTLDDVADALGFERGDLVRDQSAIAAVDAFYDDAVGDSRTGDGPDGGVHARSVTARGQDADALDVCCHLCEMIRGMMINGL